MSPMLSQCRISVLTVVLGLGLSGCVQVGGLQRAGDGASPRGWVGLPFGATPGSSVKTAEDFGVECGGPRSVGRADYPLSVGLESERPDMVFAESTTAVSGRIPTASHQGEVRLLPSDLLMARANHPGSLSAQYRRHAIFLSEAGACELAMAVRLQAEFEESDERRRALELGYDLSNVYAQAHVVAQSRDYLGQLQSAFDRFQRAGLADSLAPETLQRRRLEVDLAERDLSFGEQKLRVALEVLLAIEPSDLPIWPVWPSDEGDRIGGSHEVDSLSSVPVRFLDDSDQAVAIALRRRGDLLALESLRNTSETWSAETWRAVVGGKSWLGAGLEKLPIAWWKCRLREEQSQRERDEANHQQGLLAEAIAAKSKQIRFEVETAWIEWEQAKHHLQMTKEKRQLVRAEESRKKALGNEAVTPQELLASAQLEKTLTSEIIDNLFAIKKTECKLRHAMGTLVYQATSPGH